MLQNIYTKMRSVWKSWTTCATPEQQEQFWQHAEELKEHTVEIYELAEDVTEDVVAMAMIMSMIIKRFLHPEDTRALTFHELHECETPEDIATYVIISEDA